MILLSQIKASPAQLERIEDGGICTLEPNCEDLKRVCCSGPLSPAGYPTEYTLCLSHIVRDPIMHTGPYILTLQLDCSSRTKIPEPTVNRKILMYIQTSRTPSNVPKTALIMLIVAAGKSLFILRLNHFKYFKAHAALTYCIIQSEGGMGAGCVKWKL